MLFNLLQSFCQKKNQATLFFFIYIQETEVSTSTTTQNKSYVKKKKVMKMLWYFIVFSKPFKEK